MPQFHFNKDTLRTQFPFNDIRSHFFLTGVNSTNIIKQFTCAFSFFPDYLPRKSIQGMCLQMMENTQKNYSETIDIDISSLDKSTLTNLTCLV
jgi:hypothetical protein